jgi:hypothetical protein
MEPIARPVPPASPSRGGVAAGLLGGLVIAFACGWVGTGGGGVVSVAWTGEDPGWTPGFAEHPPGVDRDWQFTAGLREVPLPLDSPTRALFSAGDNPAGALVMYWKRPVTGLVPGGRYEAAIRVTFASDAPGGCATPAGAPGDDVALVAGLRAEEPAAFQTPDGWVRASFAVAPQGGVGATVRGAVAALGPIATGQPGCVERRFERRTLGTEAPLRLRAAEDGTAWLVVGSASAYRGRTLLYVERVALRLRPVGDGAATARLR